MRRIGGQLPRRLRRRLALLLAGVLGAAVVVLPAVASSEAPPSIQAVSENYPSKNAWSPMQVTAGAGGAVTLVNNTGVLHGVRWISSPETPACSGVPVGTTAEASSTKWNGTCTFKQAGAYTFYCTVHGSEMTATVTVTSTATTTSATTTTPTTPTQTSPGGGGGGGATPSYESGAQGIAPAGGSLLAGSSASAVKVPASQHGSSVRGALQISRAAAGGQLEVQLLAIRAALAKGGLPPSVRVGRLVRAPLSAGKVSFKVPLSARARGALRRRGRLPLSIKMRLSSPHASALTISRRVVLAR
jgi:plastocyanin